VNIPTGIRISADDVAVGDPVRIAMHTAWKIDQSALSIADQKTMLVSVRGVDPANHIAGRVEAAEKHVAVAEAADRIVNAPAAQEALARSADGVTVDDVVSPDHGGECRGGAREVNRSDGAIFDQIAVQHIVGKRNAYDVPVIADAEAEGGLSTRVAWVSVAPGKSKEKKVAGGTAGETPEELAL
jgi:hypothetical protein